MPFSAKFVAHQFIACMLWGLCLQFMAGYFFLHSWSNMFAEMLRFADREFYAVSSCALIHTRTHLCAHTNICTHSSHAHPTHVYTHLHTVYHQLSVRSLCVVVYMFSRFPSSPLSFHPPMSGLVDMHFIFHVLSQVEPSHP